jgi:hypothetical protein
MTPDDAEQVRLPAAWMPRDAACDSSDDWYARSVAPDTLELLGHLANSGSEKLRSPPPNLANCRAEIPTILDPGIAVYLDCLERLELALLDFD